MKCTLTGKNLLLGEKFFFILTSLEKGDKNNNDIFASYEIVLI